MPSLPSTPVIGRPLTPYPTPTRNRGLLTRLWFGTMYAVPNDLFFHTYDTERFIGSEVECFQGQVERCPETGRLHWQFVILFNVRKRMSAVVRALNYPGFAGHFAAKRVEAIPDLVAYCSKEESRATGDDAHELTKGWFVEYF